MYKSIRKIVGGILAIVLLIGMIPQIALSSGAQTIEPVQATSLSDGVQNIVKRAKQMVQIQWTPQQDIAGWAGGVTYYAGTTYTGLPYGQPVYADYVPWETDLDGFLEAVNDPGSLMYTSQSTYNETAPYYSIDCSAFVSWAWGLSSRQTTSSIHNFATQISDSSYDAMEVGDCLCKALDHVVLITDITYDASGNISAVEVSESTVSSVNYLCHSVWYGSGFSNSLADFQSKYLDSGYILYRSNTRDSVTYTHSCSVPLEGDNCSLCTAETDDAASSGEAVAFGIDVSHHQGTIDWDSVQSQIDFAIIRCGYGDDLTDQDDRQWTANADACTRLGIPFGVYLYSYALTDEQALSEAEHVLRLIEGYAPTLPIYLDLEDSTILNNCSASDILRHTQIFCQAIQAAGYDVGVYANYNWWTNYLTAAEYDQWDRWIARYASTTGYSKDYTIWQYTSSGSIDGISGNVDLNYWYGEFPPESHVHSYSSYISTSATCTADGTRTYTCDCGSSYAETIPATGHSYRSSSTAPTCTAAGSIRYSCTACGDSYTDTIPAAGHTYASVVTAPTCTAAGYTTHTCTVCGDTRQDSPVDALGHNYSDGICTICGAENTDLMKGDLNLDGYVSSADAVLLARFLVDLQTLSREQQLAADLNGDGSVTSADAVLLSRQLVDIQ